ncbi:unnamed protein product [Allacma fusca]|uniref:Uncharacterized protein n=1 Tax=Allacma fusca TaxID=39272 RepID=A0A8J2PGG2_9HEXA|nr:unnamed protein product [Allacma fusca]
MKALQVSIAELREAIKISTQLYVASTLDVIVWRNWLRLYFTVILAEGIYTEERMLAQDILMVHGENIGKATKLEVEFLYNIIRYDPSIITLGKYVDLDKKLLVNVAAEDIYTEEQFQSDDLLEIYDDISDEGVKSELKFFYIMLKTEPTVMKIGNYFDLDKKLIITIGVHTLTFLIAITQFGISTDYNPGSRKSASP